MLQVVEYRLRAEYSVESILEPLGYTIARYQSVDHTLLGELQYLLDDHYFVE